MSPLKLPQYQRRTQSATALTSRSASTSTPKPQPSQATAPSALSSRTPSRPDRRPLLPPAVAKAARASALQASPQPLAQAPEATHMGKAKGKSIFQSYASLPANARITFGVVIGLIAIGGLMVDRNVLQDEGQVSDAAGSGAGIGIRMVDRK